MLKKYFIFVLLFTSIFLISYSLIGKSQFINLTDHKTTKSSQLKSSYPYKKYWPYSGLLVSNASNSQEAVKLCSDGHEGAILTWDDSRNIISSNRDIYAQWITSNGELKWTENGTVICNDTSDQYNPEIIESGIGGAIIIWIDDRNGDEDIYAQRINGSGTLWIDNGTIICNKTNNQNSPKLCSDNNEGAIIVWVDNRPFSRGYDIYAQRIDKNGNCLWDSNGTVICNATADQTSPQICSDGNGGAIITWVDNRNGNEDIYAQRIDENGALWINNGTVICNATGNQNSPQLCTDENGGAIISWVDNRKGNEDIYAQRIDENGALWINNGTMICNATGNQNSPQLCTDEKGGAIITWVDNRNGNEDIYAQKVNINGNTVWTNNGTSICNIETSNQNSTQIGSDRRGGAFITWIDYRHPYPSIYIQAIDSGGNKNWEENGILICKNLNDRFSLQIISDGNRGAIITWVDNRSGSYYDIYAKRITYVITGSGYVEYESIESFQKTVTEFSETFLNIIPPLIIILGIIGLVLIIFKIRKTLSKERKWG